MLAHDCPSAWRWRALAGLLLLAALTAGCAKFDIRQNIPWAKGADGDFQRPTKVVAFWTETVLTQPNQPPLRGFGGRLMFYASEDGKPVKVKGSLVVYAFNENDRDPNHLAPDRKYVFTAEQFARHYSKSPLGHSYSVWIPWDQAGGLQTEISLLVRFTHEQGEVVIGEQAKQVLSGVPRAAPKPTEPASLPGDTPRAIQPPAQPLAAAPVPLPPIEGDVQPASYLAPLGTAAEPSGSDARQMSTTTISLPPRFGSRPPEAVARPAAAPPAAATPSSAPAAAATTGAAPSAAPPSARFERQRYRPLGGPISPLSRDRGPWPPRPAGSPFAPAPGPQSAPASAAPP